ncbi:MAG: hydroxymethylglutaryl-CoA synthase [Spirochaetes bacterium]|nr:hydroxymethylglutaryl-CoA synthase [Spirochaetota bacterium]MBU0954421.1 hydroxymethylglutaryl-CoA synthase [Spirochaetota bacterium]
MTEAKYGIGDIEVYIPEMSIDLDIIANERIRENPELEKHFGRAKAVTGQRKIRFPAPGEDSATMAAEAAYNLLTHNSGKALATLRYLSAGTETGVDHSKPLSAYVQGMLQRSGMPLPNSLASYQTQHACAGATMAMLSNAGMLAASGRDESALVLATDIARYTTRSTAEITQGAGAAAVLLEKNPRLLELDLDTVGFYSSDVDDFFRPLGSSTAKVKGSYSMQCYNQSLDEALQDHAQRAGLSPAAVLNDTDFMALHTPFRNMPEMAMKKILGTYLQLDEPAAIGWLEERGFYHGVDPVAEIGNAYTASIFICLAWTLKDRYKRMGKNIVGKKLLLASYGSGNMMMIIRATVAPNAPHIIERWLLDEQLENSTPASFSDYTNWTEASMQTYKQSADTHKASSRFRLSAIREDGYREYTHEYSAGDDQPAQDPTSGNMHQTRTVSNRN